MSKLNPKFLKSESGSFMPAFALSMLPLFAVLGMSVDYTSGVNSKNEMQNALDAATLAITTLPITTTLGERQEKLQAFYLANRGDGVATLTGYTVDSDGTAHAKSKASYDMPTNFMRLATIDNVSITVTSAATKTPALVEATFKIDKVSGYWSKKMTLFGTAIGQTTEKALMLIDYQYNNGGGTKGYGTTTVYTPDKYGKLTVVRQTQTCATTALTSPLKTSAFQDGNKQVVCTMTPANSPGAIIDVKTMEKLYLEMKVPSGNPQTLKSNDPATSNRLYLDGIEVETGKTVDIFRVVPCGKSSSQAWEDGGNAVPAPVSNADFFYTVSGKCEYSQKPSTTALTE